MKFIFAVLVLVVGAMMGSFACCQVWRMRYKQEGKKALGKWSVCLSCKKRLNWYDNIPIFSWLLLKGKCRKCGKPIGTMEILSEIGMMVIYGLLMMYFWPSLWTGMGMDVLVLCKFIIMLVLMVVMWMLFLYDGKWGEMPTKLLYLAIILAAIYRGMAGMSNYMSVFGAVLILAGIYFALYIFSKEKLVGAGDWMLCLAIALVLGNWWLALITLFLANFLGSIIMLPVAKKTKNHTIHFAPFLITGFLIVFMLQDFLSGLLSSF